LRLSDKVTQYLIVSSNNKYPVPSDVWRQYDTELRELPYFAVHIAGARLPPTLTLPFIFLCVDVPRIGSNDLHIKLGCGQQLMTAVFSLFDKLDLEDSEGDSAVVDARAQLKLATVACTAAEKALEQAEEKLTEVRASLVLANAQFGQRDGTREILQLAAQLRRSLKGSVSECERTVEVRRLEVVAAERGRNVAEQELLGAVMRAHGHKTRRARATALLVMRGIKLSTYWSAETVQGGHVNALYKVVNGHPVWRELLEDIELDARAREDFSQLFEAFGPVRAFLTKVAATPCTPAEAMQFEADVETYLGTVQSISAGPAALSLTSKMHQLREAARFYRTHCVGVSEEVVELMHQVDGNMLSRIRRTPTLASLRTMARMHMLGSCVPHPSWTGGGVASATGV